ncbi:hypothetical protein [Actinoplanes sp. NPDC049681]|uniref:hypothetical protein n=1 Tax=Actinoplanes sp. NPDC049681 TaxID=3363905 RepID=UPI00378ECF6D
MNPRTIPAVLDLSRLGPLPSTPDFDKAGESDGIWRVPAWPGHLFKRLNAEAARKLDITMLDRLVAQPQMLTDPGDRRLIDEATSWPASRIVDRGATIGVLTPEAPAAFSVSWLAKARTNPNRYGPIPVDYLAKPNAWLAERGIPQQSAADRAATCLSLARVACLFERCGIVYADWSYANAFWHPTQHIVYVFDLDGCSYGSRPHVFTPEFEDPLTPDRSPVDTYTDRYRVALLVGRMLTGKRRKDEVYAALGFMSGAVPQTLLRMLDAGVRTDRPSIADLTRSFGQAVPTARPADASGVVTWRPRQNHNVTRTPNPAPGSAAPTWRPRQNYRPRTPTPAPRPAPAPARAQVPVSRPVRPAPPRPSPPVPPSPPPAVTRPTQPAPSGGGAAGPVLAVLVLIVLVVLCAVAIF